MYIPLSNITYRLYWEICLHDTSRYADEFKLFTVYSDMKTEEGTLAPKQLGWVESRDVRPPDGGWGLLLKSPNFAPLASWPEGGMNKKL